MKPWEGLKPAARFRGVETFTIDDAKMAGLSGKGPWKSYPRAMLFNRAISDGRRTFAPDLFGGGKGYTPEELGSHPPKEDLHVEPVVSEVPEPESTTYVEATYSVVSPPTNGATPAPEATPEVEEEMLF